MGRYASVQMAKDAGATGTDTEIEAALDSGEVVINRYCRDVFTPADLAFLVPVDEWGRGYLPVTCYALTDAVQGSLDYDGRTWTAAGFPPFPSMEFLVAGDYGWREVPLPVAMANARLAAMYLPAPFTAQTDAEGNPIGQPPAPTEGDQTDPGPPTARTPTDRTTGDPVADAWLEPYKTNKVLI